MFCQVETLEIRNIKDNDFHLRVQNKSVNNDDEK